MLFYYIMVIFLVQRGGLIYGKKFIQDPWAKLTTRNGLAWNEVISSLQKCIRRGLVEDIGMGYPPTTILINNLNSMRKNYAYAYLVFQYLKV